MLSLSRWKAPFCVTTVLSFACLLWAQDSSDKRQPMAEIGQEKIYEENLNPAINGQLYQLEKQRYELRLNALLELVDRQLLETEARSSHLTVEELLHEKVEGTLPPWSVAELQAFYLARSDQFKKPFDEVRPEIEKAFLQARREQARKAYVETLRQAAGLTVLLPTPRASVPVDSTRVLGASNARVTIVEFADFQCPYSQSMQAVLKELLRKYPGEVRVSFRDFPLRNIHPQAEAAAEAARCAHEQGKFWEYHDLLFARHARLDPDGLVENARSLGLETGRFGACLASGRYKEAVENDVILGKSFGVAGTPTIYINGLSSTGSQPSAAFEKIVDSELAEKNKKTVE